MPTPSWDKPDLVCVETQEYDYRSPAPDGDRTPIEVYTEARMLVHKLMRFPPASARTGLRRSWSSSGRAPPPNSPSPWTLTSGAWASLSPTEVSAIPTGPGSYHGPGPFCCRNPNARTWGASPVLLAPGSASFATWPRCAGRTPPFGPRRFRPPTAGIGTRRAPRRGGRSPKAPPC